MRKATVIQRITMNAVLEEQYQPRDPHSGTSGLTALNGCAAGFPQHIDFKTAMVKQNATVLEIEHKLKEEGEDEE